MVKIVTFPKPVELRPQRSQRPAAGSTGEPTARPGGADVIDLSRPVERNSDLDLLEAMTLAEKTASLIAESEPDRLRELHAVKGNQAVDLLILR